MQNLVKMLVLSSMFLSFSFYWLALVGATSIYDVQPQQIHLSFSDNARDLVVTWSTMNSTNEASLVEYGIVESNLTQTATGVAKEFIDGGLAKRVQFIHRVKLKGLLPKQKYFYRCGSWLGWSSLYNFLTIDSSADWSPRLAVYGDLGSENPQSLSRLQKEAQEGLYDAVFHVGDFGYDLYEEDGQLGDRFMRQIEPIAAYLPYMTSVGNHEEKYNFSHYKARFSMPGNENGLMYSFNLGPAHIISISTEFYYFINYGFKQIALQYDWLTRDLEEANAPENRTVRPWIITMGHRPMYCSNTDQDDCTKKDTLTRVGLSLFHWFALEPLFYKHGVDLALWAHEHSYERLWPLYNRTVMNGSLEHPYTNPKAPVHVTTGSAGCREERDEFIQKLPYWSAFRSNDYGYSRLLIANKTHLHLEQVSDDQNGRVVDDFWITKDHVRGYLDHES